MLRTLAHALCGEGAAAKVESKQRVPRSCPAADIRLRFRHVTYPLVGGSLARICEVEILDLPPPTHTNTQIRDTAACGRQIYQTAVAALRARLLRWHGGDARGGVGGSRDEA